MTLTLAAAVTSDGGGCGATTGSDGSREASGDEYEESNPGGWKGWRWGGGGGGSGDAQTEAGGATCGVIGGCTGCGAGATGGGGGCVAAAAAAAAAFWADFSRARARREGFFSSTAFGASLGTFLGLSGPPRFDPDASLALLGRAAGRDGLPPLKGRSGISASLDDASDAVALGEGDRVVVGTLLPFGFALGERPRGVRPVLFSLAFRSRSSSARSRATASSACRSA